MDDSAGEVFASLMCCPFYLIFGILNLVFYLVMILMVVLWVMMLVDIVNRKFENENDKVMWILIVALTGGIGALIYYIMVKSKDQK